jgi:phosphatidylserine decarboxylase
MRAQTLLEARWILLILALAGVAVWFVSTWLALVFLALFIFTIAFFRDPDRPVPPDPNLIVAPADGTVRDIVDLNEEEVLKMKTRRVGIFLSIFDVHTNRAPIDGRIIYRQHHEGLCLDARNPDCP